MRSFRHLTSTQRFKVVVVGDSRTGKTSLICRFVHKSFIEHADRYVPIIHIGDLQIRWGEQVLDIEVKLHDTSAHPDYDTLRPREYEGADVVLVTFDLNELDSLTSLKERWIPEAVENAQEAAVVVVGCKKDLRDGKAENVRLYEIERGKEFGGECGVVAWFECSAKDGEGVEEMFERIAVIALERREKQRERRRCLVM